MFKKYYLILTFLLSSFTFSCQLLDNASIVNKVEDLNIEKEVKDETLIKNYNAVLEAIEKEKSNLTIKGDLVRQAFVTSSMGVSYKIKLDKSF